MDLRKGLEVGIGVRVGFGHYENLEAKVSIW